jgi:hypothetical protein
MDLSAPEPGPSTDYVESWLFGIPAPTSISLSEISSLPNVPLLRLLAKDDHLHYIKAPGRILENTYLGNNGLI